MNKIFVALFLLAIIVAPTQALNLSRRPSASNSQLKKIQAQKGTWASFLVSLAELHLQSGGPLDELVEAVEGVVNDLSVKLQKAHDDFDKRTELHESEVARIQSLIDNADSDIANTIEFLGVLDLQKSAIELEITNAEEAVELNIKATADAITIRAEQHEVFVKVVPEHQDAIAALEEALAVLSQLHETEGAASFAQIKKFQKHVDIVNKNMKKGQDKSFLNALVELAVKSQFADQGAIAKVEKIMNDVKNNLIASLAQFNEEEAQQVIDHAADLAAKEAELNSLNISIIEFREELEITEARIVDNEEFLEQRKQDKIAREQDLQDENDSYVRDTEIYEDLVAQFQNELKACQAALDHLNNAEIADFIGDRMEQDVVIDQPHGDGIAVEVNHME